MDLKKVRICGQAMNISLHGDAEAPRKRKGRPNPKGKHIVKPKGKPKGKPKVKPKGKPKGKSKVKRKFEPAARKRKPGKPSK
jgi:hypothetical protein